MKKKFLKSLLLTVMLVGCSVDSNSSQKFSMLSNISEIYRINNKFEFILDYPERSNWFWWRQTNNPIYEMEVFGVRKAEGFESIYNSSKPPFGMNVAKAFKPESDFEIRIFRCDFVKILVNPIGFTAFCASHIKKSFIYKILRP